MVDSPTGGESLGADNLSNVERMFIIRSGRGMRMPRRKLISLFSGAMGLDLGLERAGFESVVCNEIDKASVATIRHNRPGLPVIAESVEHIDFKSLSRAVGSSVKAIDLLAGGPPCQAFSVYGNRKGIEDGRGRLIFEFIRLVDEVRPKTFLMENVRGLHSMSIRPGGGGGRSLKEHRSHGSLLREILRRFESIGYRVDCFLVNAVNYGAPQIRERLICIGNRFGEVAVFPPVQRSNRLEDGLRPFATLRDAIGPGFVDSDPSLMNFSPRKLAYLALVPPGGNWRSLPVEIQKESMGKSWYLKGGRSATWRKLSWDFPSPTVVTMPNHASTSMCHPSELRALTAGECAAIQGFAADWHFVGTPAEKYRQIGNAVPVRLGEVAGAALTALLDRIEMVRGRRRSNVIVPSRVLHLRPHVRTRTFWKNGKAFAGDVSYYEEMSDRTQLPLFEAA